MRTTLKVILLGAACTSLAACQLPECKITLTCDPPVRHSAYYTPSYYSPTDGRVMYAPEPGTTSAKPAM